MLFDVSQIVFPDLEAFANNFLGVLRSSHESVLQSLVVQEINVYVVAQSCFRVNSSLGKSLAGLSFRLLKLDDDAWICFHSC